MSLEPITREEHLMIGDYIEPVTRQEKILAGEDIDPVTREEWFLKEYRSGGGDIEVVSLSATENKTYTAPEGKAYSPVNVNVPIPEYHSDSLSVTENGTYTPGSGTDGYNEVNVNVQPTLAMKNITANGTYTASDDNADGYSSVSVNVPLPSNAYLLQTIEHEQVATFTDGTDNYVKSLEVAIEPVQSGSGDPSPTNIRPISGWSAVDVTVADDTTDPTTENVYTIDLDGTRYGGKLDIVNGDGTDRLGYVDLGTLTWSTQGNPNTFQAVISDMLTPSNNIMCSHYPTIPASTSAGNMPDKSIKTYGNNSAKYIIVKDSRYSDVATFKTAMNGVQLVYELAIPTTYDTQPTIIKSIQGENNLFASTGEIEWMQYWSKEVN